MGKVVDFLYQSILVRESHFRYIKCFRRPSHFYFAIISTKTLLQTVKNYCNMFCACAIKLNYEQIWLYGRYTTIKSCFHDSQVVFVSRFYLIFICVLSLCHSVFFIFRDNKYKHTITNY